LGLLRAAQPSDRAAMMSQSIKPVSMPMP
jgi:hypothetical protein